MEEEQRRVGRTAAAGLTFWTLCPYCYYAHEYEKAYEGCCLRCATCGRGFHAAAIRAPPEATAFVGGGGGGRSATEQYELGAREGGGARGGEEKKIDAGDYLVEISSEDEGGEAKKEVEVEEEEREEEEEEEEESGGELEFEYEGDDILVSA
ncbi:hypothetical protein NL676_019852 [Syzygium grande]|nr:hypothetical protein NL676_019852 [Syzygium grande]